MHAPECCVENGWDSEGEGNLEDQQWWYRGEQGGSRGSSMIHTVTDMTKGRGHKANGEEIQGVES